MLQGIVPHVFKSAYAIAAKKPDLDQAKMKLYRPI